MFLFEWAVKLLINELLADYFNSASYKIMLCFACFEKEIKFIDNIIEISKKSQSKKEKKKKSLSKIKIKKNSKLNLNFKIYLLLKYCF